jgi:hypothetical protein
MRNRIVAAAVAAALLVPLLAHAAAWDTWHPNLEAGRKAAKASGKPLLVITTWKDGV